jgi:hypothetical protein
MRDRLDELIDQFHGNDRKFAEACFRHWVRRGQDEPFNFVDKVQPATAEEKWTPGDCIGSLALKAGDSVSQYTVAYQTAFKTAYGKATIHRHRCPYCKNRTYVDPHPADSQGE